jgi:hypothetical protein
VLPSSGTCALISKYLYSDCFHDPSCCITRDLDCELVTKTVTVNA